MEERVEDQIMLKWNIVCFVAALARGKSIRTKVTQYSTPMESIQAEVNRVLEEFDDDDIP